MKLEAAIKILKETQDSYLKYELYLAIETVLSALENSIPKKKIEEKIEELKDLKSKTCQKIFHSQRCYLTEKIEDVLQELLEE